MGFLKEELNKQGIPLVIFSLKKVLYVLMKKSYVWGNLNEQMLMA